MQDPRRIHEARSFWLERSQVLGLTLLMVVALGAAFAAGVVVGRRDARMHDGGALADSLALLDAQHQAHNRVYDSLRTDGGDTEPPSTGHPPAGGVAGEGQAASRRRPAEGVVQPAEGVVQPAEGVVQPARHAIPKVPVKGGKEPLQGIRDEAAELRRALAAGPPPVGAYTVQVSAFSTEEEANAYAAALRRRGFAPFVVSATVPGRGTWYRVRMGSFFNEEQAARAKQLLARSDIAAWVLRSER